MNAHVPDVPAAVKIECPNWAVATILYRDERGSLVGYGYAKRTGEDTAEVEVISSPEGAALLSSVPQRRGE